MKRRSAPDSSLELLLDTICNTFGGVLFLAILVCILLRNTSHSKNRHGTGPQVSEAEVLDLIRRQQELESALEGLRAAAAQQDRLTAQFIEPNAKELHDSLAQTREVRNSLDDERRKVLADITAKQSNAAAIERELENLQQHLTNARSRAAEAETALKVEITVHSATAALPREHISTKHQIGFVVRYSRLYQWLRYDRDGKSQGLNTEEFVTVTEDEDRLETRPKPYAGTPIEQDGAQTLLEARFRLFNPRKDCLTIAVWDDSFEVFQKVKAAAINAGFEYRIILMREGKSLADRGGSDSRVQ